MTILDLTAQQLRRAAAIKDKIEKLHQELTSILGASTPAATAPFGRRKKRRMSAAAKAAISKAAKARWVKIKAAQKK